MAGGVLAAVVERKAAQTVRNRVAIESQQGARKDELNTMGRKLSRPARVVGDFRLMLASTWLTLDISFLTRNTLAGSFRNRQQQFKVAKNHIKSAAPCPSMSAALNLSSCCDSSKAAPPNLV